MQQGDVKFTQQNCDDANTDSSLKCPLCKSEHIESLNFAKKAGGSIGTVAGATLGFASTLSGVEVGATAGLVAGPVGAIVGGLLGGLIAAAVGGSAGCAAGVALGGAIDESVLDNYHCLDCDYTFGKQQSRV